MRLALVAALVAGFALARLAYGRHRRRIEHDTDAVPRLPAALLAGAERTWVVFTTPYCASCGPVAERLAGDGRVVVVDAAEEPELAESFRIRSAPTALLAGADGEVLARLVGPNAVEAYLNEGSSASARRGFEQSRADTIG